MVFLRLFLVAVLAAFLLSPLSSAADKKADGPVRVDGYTRKDGTYVAPHNRTAPNQTKNDNWSTKGNVNPYTGKEGTKPRDKESPAQKSSADTPAPARSSAAKPSKKVYAQPATSPAEPRQRSHAELLDTVRRCNQLLDSYVRAPYGKSPFNAARYDEIKEERDLAEGELRNGH